jgi:hypothetical protein
LEVWGAGIAVMPSLCDLGEQICKPRQVLLQEHCSVGEGNRPAAGR